MPKYLFTEDDAAEAQGLMLGLLSLNRKAAAEGFTLFDLLAATAKDKYGVSISADAPVVIEEPAEPAPEEPAEPVAP